MRVASSLVLLVITAACGAQPTPLPTASTASSTATPSIIAPPASSAPPPATYSTSLPSRGSRPVTQRAVRGGAGDTRPNAKSMRASEASTDRQMRKPSKVDMVDCSKLPDNVAECDADKLYFCDDKELFVVDCNAEAKFGGASSGGCFEGEKFIDCLGCGRAADGTNVCCDLATSVCCDDAGDCWAPKG